MITRRPLGTGPTAPTQPAERGRRLLPAEAAELLARSDGEHLERGAVQPGRRNLQRRPDGPA